MFSDALEDLAASIPCARVYSTYCGRQIIEQKYEIIAGERRWRASKYARL